MHKINVLTVLSGGIFATTSFLLVGTMDYNTIVLNSDMPDQVFKILITVIVISLLACVSLFAYKTKTENEFYILYSDRVQEKLKRRGFNECVNELVDSFLSNDTDMFDNVYLNGEKIKCASYETVYGTVEFIRNGRNVNVSFENE